MPSVKNTYMGGMDQDTSNLKFEPSKYFELNDMRIVTEDGSSTGALENEKGNKKIATFHICPS